MSSASRLSIRLLLPTACMLLAVLAPANAQTFRVLQTVPLRAAHLPDASVTSTVVLGAEVNLLQLRGGWAEVQAGATQGWLRASQLDLPRAEVASAARLETGRREAGATAVTVGIRALPPRSTRHALIIGVGEYEVNSQRPVPPLAGVQHDIVSAVAMARLLQVPVENMTVLRNSAATREGVQQALRELDTRVRPGDRVFFYWSGHGSRYYDATEGGCVETLVPYDLKDIGNRDFARLFEPLARKADKMFVVYDACHSGGVDGTSSIATRSLSASYQPKVAPADGACTQSSNLRSRGLESATAAFGLSSQDLVHVSSSRPDEVSFDNAEFGGLATSSLLQCMGGEARDLDASGSVSVEEISICAQAKIEAKLAKVGAKIRRVE